MGFDRFISELKQRNVLRVAGVYAVAAWGVFSIADKVFETFDYPREASMYFLVAAVLGLPVAIGLSWVYERGPDGKIRRTRRSEEGAPKKKFNLLDWAFLAAIGGMVLVFIASAVTLGAALRGATGKTVAVLPFDVFSAAPETAYFADGLVEEVTNSLAQVPDLKVAGRTSAYYFKDKDQNITEIGRMLNVAHVLEGSVRRDGDRLRVTAQLIRADNGYHMWSETYDRTMDDAFAIQTEIAEDVADALKAELKAGRRGLRLPKVVAPPDPETYRKELVVAGQIARKGKVAMQAAQAGLRDLLRIKPDSARYHADYAYVTAYLVQNHLEGDFAPAIRDAEAHIAEALRLDPNSSKAYLARGVVANVRFIRESRQAAEGEALAAFKRAVELDPKDAEANALYGILLNNIERFKEALPYLDKAVELEPLHRFARNGRAAALFRTGRTEEAIQNYQANIESFPDLVDAKEQLAEIYVETGRLDEALVWYREAAKPLTDPAASIMVSNLSYNLGMPNEAEAALRQWKDHPIVGPLSDAILLIVAADWEALLPLAQKHLAEPEPDPVWRDGVALAASMLGKGEMAREQVLITSPELFEPSPEVVIRLAPEAVNNAFVIEQSGDRAQARRVLSAVLAVTSPKEGIRQDNDTRIARVKAYALLGEKELALKELRAAIDAGWRQLYDLEIFMRLDAYPMMATLRSEPRFAAMIREVEADNARMRAALQGGASATKK